ncbi:AraC family transcriptional regulator [Methylovorus glucosotrophus]|uniref:Transcriptional regulator, AraC family n=1 Tax=Methylovorus glucosotrophus (strain SIP3-4) TaxID=582744 RepID=C6XAV0_METGS|nr:AraC family transcriptional regulator [Methylovorus glucosotrophus]ACT51720.1 transcriptional regulator, AraC family [Methylovorus glucosotrophus SIP3-4]
MSQRRAEVYAMRFQKVLDHIEQHLDQSLSMDALCDIAGFSRFHFHRQFADYIGITVARYILLLRLRHASYQLAFDPKVKIIDIALNAGFETPESFTRAFGNIFGQSPSAFRKNPDWEAWHVVYGFRLPEGNKIMQVEIVNVETTMIAVKEHRGAPDKLNHSVGDFIAWRKQTGSSPKNSSRTFGIAYDNPDTTEPSAFRFDIAGEIKTDIAVNEQGIVVKSIPGGRCARVRHHGSHTRIGESIYPLYREWLPESGEELRDFPLYFHYVNLLPETPEAELITDIYLPLK